MQKQVLPAFIDISELESLYSKSKRQYYRDRKKWVVYNNKVLISSLDEDLQSNIEKIYRNRITENQNDKSNTNKNIAKQKIIIDYQNSKLSVVEFCKLYNKNPKYPEYKSVSFMTIYRWLDELNQVKVKEKKGYGLNLSEEDKKIIKSLYFSINKWSVAKVYREWKNITGKTEPSYRTIKRYIDSLPPIMNALREGGSYINDKFMPFVIRDYTKYRVNELWVSDHHMLDIFVRDGEKVYRPWITTFMDMRSRKIVGWHISKNPSSYTILQAFYKAVERFGKPDGVYFDNGKDYKSKRLQGTSIFVNDEKIKIKGVFEKYNIDVHFCEPYHGQSKPIERFFGTLCQDFSKEFESYTGSNTKSKLEETKKWKDKKSSVKLTVEELSNSLEKWLERYHNTIHTGNGMNATPEEIYNAGVRNIIRVNFNRIDKQEIFGKAEIHPVTRNGIKFEGINYWSLDLVRYLGSNKKFKVVRDVDDISKVYVYDLENNLVCEAINKYIGEGKTEEDIAEVKKKRKLIRKLLNIYKEIDLKGNSIEEQLSNLEKADKEKKVPEKMAAGGYVFWN